ncbi:lysozyme inhibitor LprI family protein [Phreatobacter sp.]|uniref:lysozyme inhibitor LprI family protein n=1 Tax=Phreatobacter sp. TaxID=1966341 RepID=UPI003F72B51E
MSRFLALSLLIASLAAVLPSGARSTGCTGLAAAAGSPACLQDQARAAEAGLAAARHEAQAVIDGGSEGNLSPEDRKAWSEAFGRTIALWTTFRDAVCAPRLLAFERGLAAEAAGQAALACHIAITDTMAKDLSFRFREPQAGAPRASFEATGGSPGRRDVIAVEGDAPLCRHPGHGGDYQPLTACTERHVARVDGELNAVWARALAAIRARGDLSEADRAAWIEALRAAQRPWAQLRDVACRAEAFETPNRHANSIYANLVGPCLIVETEERIRALKTAYRLR